MPAVVKTPALLKYVAVVPRLKVMRGSKESPVKKFRFKRGGTAVLSERINGMNCGNILEPIRLDFNRKSFRAVWSICASGLKQCVQNATASNF